MGMLRPIDKLAQTFKEGGGVAQAEYPDVTYHGMDRFTAGWFENLLVQEWLPAVPAVKAALEACPSLPQVSHRRLRHLPAEHLPGDSQRPGRRRCFPGQVRATRRVQGNPRPVRSDTTFDVIHDAVDPREDLSSQAEAAIASFLDQEVRDAMQDGVPFDPSPIIALVYRFRYQCGLELVRHYRPEQMPYRLESMLIFYDSTPNAIDILIREGPSADKRPHRTMGPGEVLIISASFRVSDRWSWLPAAS